MWNAEILPCPDGKENHNKSKDAATHLEEYHDAPPATNINKFSSPVQGLFLSSELLGGAADICKELTNYELKSGNGVQVIKDFVTQKEYLSVIDGTFESIGRLLTTRGGDTEPLNNS